MSLKAVELQVALPRMTDVGRMQEQELQRPMQEQLTQQEARKQADLHNRQRPIEVKETEKNRIRERESKEQKQNRQQEFHAEGKEKSEVKKTESVSMRDPLRGRFIDFSL